MMAVFDRLPSYKFRFENHILDVPNFRKYNINLIGYCLDPEYEGSEPCGAILFIRDDKEVWCHFSYWRIAEILEDLERFEEADEVRRYNLF